MLDGYLFSVIGTTGVNDDHFIDPIFNGLQAATQHLFFIFDDHTQGKRLHLPPNITPVNNFIDVCNSIGRRFHIIEQQNYTGNILPKHSSVNKF